MGSLRLLASAALVLAAGLAAPGQAATDPIQPGDYARIGGSACTLNFVYDGGGNTYIGLAAHCVDKVGDDVATINGETFGDVAMIGDANATAPDWALVKVRPAYRSRISGAVKGYPKYPTGVTTPAETSSGDLVQISGYGVGYGLTNVTQEKRQAVLGYDDAKIHTVAGPIHWGDSGGPLVHVRTGKALGIVSRLCIGGCTEEGPTVQGILAAARARGLKLTLRTA